MCLPRSYAIELSEQILLAPVLRNTGAHLNADGEKLPRNSSIFDSQFSREVQWYEKEYSSFDHHF